MLRAKILDPEDEASPGGILPGVLEIDFLRIVVPVLCWKVAKAS
jgi:hypothetical protein